MKPYHPSGKVSILLLPIAILLAIAASAILGYICHLIWQLVDKIHDYLSSLSNWFIDGAIAIIDLFFPISYIFITFAFVTIVMLVYLVAFITTSSLRWSKVRNYLVLVGVGFSTALIFQSIGHCLDFHAFLSNPSIVYESGQPVPKNLWSYLIYCWEVSRWTAWVWPLFTFFYFQSIVMSQIKELAKQPFCEASDRWFGKAKLLGIVNAADLARLDEILDTDRFDEIDFTIEPATVSLTDRLWQFAIYASTADEGEVKSALIEVRKIARRLTGIGPIYFYDHRSGVISGDNYRQLQAAVSAPIVN